jgi:DNA topoisomerase-3
MARDFYDALPDQAKYPDMTALWHEQQEAIKNGELNQDKFILDLVAYMKDEIERVFKEGLQLNIKYHPCPKCGKALQLLKGQKGPYWGCTGWREGCKVTYQDNNGQPVLEAKEGPACECGKGHLRLKNGQKGAFWGCSAYPECRITYPDKDGKPDKEAGYSRTGESKLHNCMACGRPLRRIENKKDKSVFWGCTGYQSGECKKTYPDLDGKPDYSKK